MYFSECHNIPESKANNELDYEGNSRFEWGGIQVQLKINL